jgi:hypothetical protein
MRNDDNKKRIYSKGQKLVKVNTKQTSTKVASKSAKLLRLLGTQPKKPRLIRDILSGLGSALCQAPRKRKLISIGS